MLIPVCNQMLYYSYTTLSDLCQLDTVHLSNLCLFFLTFYFYIIFCRLKLSEAVSNVSDQLDISLFIYIFFVIPTYCTRSAREESNLYVLPLRFV